MFPIRFSNSRLCNLLNYESVTLKNEKIFFLITYLIKKRRFPIDEWKQLRHTVVAYEPLSRYEK
jgi:hypothetical protein